MHSSRFWQRFLGVILCTSLATLFSFSPWCDSLDRGWYDLLFRLRGSVEAPQNIVIVAIDEDSFSELDMQWPWPRSLHADLVNSLTKAGVKTVVFDILFAEPSFKVEDTWFAETISKNKNVVLVNEISKVEDSKLGYSVEKVIDPTPISNLASIDVPRGYSNVQLDADGFVRRIATGQSGEKALSVVAVEKFKDQNINNLPEDLFINYLGPARTIKTISYYQALDPEQFLPKGFLENSLVFVGLSTLAEAEIKSNRTDHFPVPFTTWGDGYMPGVEIHASAANSIITSSYIKPISEASLFIYALLLGIIGGMLLFQYRPTVGAFIYLLVTAIFFGISYRLFITKGVFLSLPYLVASFTTCFLVSPFFHYFWARKQRAYIKGAFETYLSPKLVNEVMKSSSNLELGGEEREGTVLFLDLEGFTSISEKLAPKELIALINRNLGELAEIIMKHDGMIDKYIGDAIMAVWGVPIEDERHAEKACSAALEIISNLKAMNEREKNLSGTDVSLRIGISSGTLLAGNVGGGKRLNYTVLGNSVNLASRLEGLNKDFKTRVLISEDTEKLLGDGFKRRDLGCVRVKGQEREVCIYELGGEG